MLYYYIILYYTIENVTAVFGKHGCTIDNIAGLRLIRNTKRKSKLGVRHYFSEKKYNVETKTMAVDFTEPEKIYHDIEKQLTGLDVGVLINNVGMSYSHPEYFVENKDKERLYADIINCNIFPVTSMCRLVLPRMLEKKRGAVVNISSLSALMSSPLLTVYAASKAYVDKFTADLAAEYSKRGVVFQCLFPGYVATKMSKIRSSTWMAPAPDKFVSEALRTVGVQQRTTGYFPHSLLLAVVRTLDYCAPDLAKWIIVRTQENIRARAVRKSQNNL